MSDELIQTARASIVGYNDKNWDAVRDACTADLRYDEVATHRKIQGIGQVIEAWQGWAKAFPDSTAAFHDAHVAGDHTVVQELTWTGTHTGPMLTPDGEIPATHKSIEMRGVVIVEVRNGKIASMTQYFDMMTMMTQLGLAG